MAKNTIYVTGHKNPDSDAIISAMAYAYLKQQMGYDAIAVRAGAVNPETEYILNMFNEFAPPLATDIKTCVRDIDFDDVVTCRKEDDMKTVLRLMLKNDVKVVAVTDDDRHLIGVVSMSDLTKPTVVDRHLKHIMLSETPLSYIAKAIDGTILHDAGNTSNGKTYVASYHHLSCEGRIVVTSDNPSREKQVINKGARIMIICGETCSDDIIELARKKNCTVIITDNDIYDVCKEIDRSMPIERLMSTNITTFRYDDYVDDVKLKINKSKFRAYPVIDARDHVIGMISRYHVFQHTNRNLIMVDHNEFAQSIDGAESANVMEIIDHHRIGGIKTSSPVFFRTEQLGSCSTIITKIFEENNIPIPEDLAGMLCCAILSDTLNFNSVTCTQEDIDIAHKLGKIAGLNVEKLGPKILSAGANLSNKSVEDIFHHDLKFFEIRKLKVAVGQINIVSFEAIIPLKNNMIRHLEQYAAANGCNICMMVFSLIDGTGSYVLMRGSERAVAEYAFEDMAINVDGYMFLPKVMSRKLQIIPRLTAAVEEK